MTAAAGWYPASDRPGSLRYWDGAAWTTAYREPSPPSPPEVPRQVDNSAAWLLVALPFVSLGVTLALLMNTVAVDDTLVTVLLVFVTWIVVVWDLRLLRARGVEVSQGWALLVPVYLFQRSRAARIPYLIPVAWLVVFSGYLVAQTAVANHYGPFTMDMPRIEQSIKQEIDTSASTNSEVHCPTDDSYVLGDSFDCSVTDTSGSITERVTVHENGYVAWVVVPEVTG